MLRPRKTRGLEPQRSKIRVSKQNYWFRVAPLFGELALSIAIFIMAMSKLLQLPSHNFAESVMVEILNVTEIIRLGGYHSIKALTTVRSPLLFDTRLDNSHVWRLNKHIQPSLPSVKLDMVKSLDPNDSAKIHKTTRHELAFLGSLVDEASTEDLFCRHLWTRYSPCIRYDSWPLGSQTLL